MLTDVDMIVSLASYTERHKKKVFLVLIYFTRLQCKHYLQIETMHLLVRYNWFISMRIYTNIWRHIAIGIEIDKTISKWVLQPLV